MRKNKKGFSLLEVMVAVLIIAILGTVVGINVLREPGRARQTKAIVTMGTLRVALTRYHADAGRFPTDAQGLEALCRKPEIEPVPRNYRGPYLDSATPPLDPWRRPYVYMAPGPAGEPYFILTYGADGEEGGEGENADITSENFRDFETG